MEPAATRPDRMLWLAWLIENTREPCHREKLARAIEIRERRLQGVPEYRQPAGPPASQKRRAVINAMSKSLILTINSEVV